MSFEFAANAFGERDGAARAAALRCSELAPPVAAADTDHTRGGVDVLPAQREKFAAAQAGHRGGQVEDTLRRPSSRPVGTASISRSSSAVDR